MRARGFAAAVASTLVLSGCGGSVAGSLAEPATTAVAAIDAEERWVAKTSTGATITAEAPADDEHPLVAQAEDYRDAADAPETFYVVVVYDNTEGREPLQVFGGARLVTGGEEVPVPHFAAEDGVFEEQIEGSLPLDLHEEAGAWHSELYQHQVVVPGSVEEVLLGTIAEISDIDELWVSVGDEDEVELEPAS